MTTVQIFVAATLLLATACSTGAKNSAKTLDNAQNTSTAKPLFSEVKDVISDMRQLTYDGKRSGEGYFSTDGQMMIFQSEREESNPFYQMYLKKFLSGETTRLSPGYGKTTCGWISSDKRWAIYSSTHADPKAKDKQKVEFDLRASGQQRRYAWDYDETYDIYRTDLAGKTAINLTNTLGYDAEGSISPNGKYIAFASNRTAYSAQLSDKEKEILARDPSYFMDIFIMNSDGTNVRQLTKSVGYDGGPFFSPDGERLTWRKFTPDGHSAEIYTMNIDGSDQKQITRLNAMSWAPFYHPSNDYIIFTSNILGYQNFELFVVDVNGTGDPVRVTSLDGFDGLPVFKPDGSTLTWNRKLSSTESQIVIANWSDTKIRAALQLPAKMPPTNQFTSTITATDLKATLKYLASREMAGRATGSPQELKINADISKYFSEIGLKPFAKNSYTQEFQFLKNTTLGPQNSLVAINTSEQNLNLNETWRPLAFSKSTDVSASSIVFAGYGIRAPKEKDMNEYDSYAGLNVKDKWVMILRYVPEKTSAARRAHLLRYSKLEHKAFVARELGAKGLIVVSGPNSNAKSDLIAIHRYSGSDSGLAGISLTDAMAEQFLALLQKSLKDLQTELDLEKPFTGFEIPNLKLSAKIDIKNESSPARNTIGQILIPGAKQTLVIGAHVDHLGDHPNEDSLMNSKDNDPIHYGADDNASGVSAVLEMAHYFQKLKSEKNYGGLKQNIIFALWSGEELGNLGSTYFTRVLANGSLKNTKISAYINFDMVGRLKVNPATQLPEPLLIQGIASSENWRAYIERANVTMPVQLQNDPYLPTDAMSFYVNKIPVVSFFTGVHTDYHTPRDTEDKINYPGLTQITQTVATIATLVASSSTPLVYKPVDKAGGEMRRGFRIFLGTIPDYTQENVKGVLLSGVITGGPADKAGLKTGDIIVEFSSRKIENIHDYVYTLETIRPDEPTKIVVIRKGSRQEINITPTAKE